MEASGIGQRNRPSWGLAVGFVVGVQLLVLLEFLAIDIRIDGFTRTLSNDQPLQSCDPHPRRASAQPAVG